MLDRGVFYTDINSQQTRYAPANVDCKDDKPTTGKSFKVYFKDGTAVVECDISPDAKVKQEGDVFKLIAGHIRLKCATCGNDLHCHADQRTVYLSTKQRMEYVDGEGGVWMLPTLTILEPVYCQYVGGEEHTGEGCRWAVKIACGVAYPVSTSRYGKGAVVLTAR